MDNGQWTMDDAPSIVYRLSSDTLTIRLGLSLVDQIGSLVCHSCPRWARMTHNKGKSTMLPQAKAL
jgi:hypothetical protein